MPQAFRDRVLLFALCQPLGTRGKHLWARKRYGASVACWLGQTLLVVLVATAAGSAYAWANPLAQPYLRPVQQWLVQITGWRPPSVISAAPGLVADFEIGSPDGQHYRSAFDGAVCYSGEMLRARVTLAQPAYLLAFDWDGSRAYPVDGRVLRAVLHGSGTTDVQVRLDNNPGTETLYVIASVVIFTYADQIEAGFHRLDGGRGGEASRTALSLPADMVQASFTCDHRR